MKTSATGNLSRTDFASYENAQVHISRVKTILPPTGKVGILYITDKQFGSMELFNGKKHSDKPEVEQQLELF